MPSGRARRPRRACDAATIQAASDTAAIRAAGDTSDTCDARDTARAHPPLSLSAYHLYIHTTR